MAKRNRSEHSRLMDNIGRRIRHLKEDLQKDRYDDLTKTGIKRNIDNLEKYKKNLKKLASKNEDKRLTNEQIYEASLEMKSNDNLSMDKEKINKITFKLVGTEPDEIFEEGSGYFQDISNDDISDVLSAFSELVGKYIGVSGDIEAREKAQDTVEKINEHLNSINLTDKQIATLNRMVQSLNIALSGSHKFVDGKMSGILHPIG